MVRWKGEKFHQLAPFNPKCDQPLQPYFFLFLSMRITMQTSNNALSNKPASPDEVKAVTQALAAPFEAGEIRFKPGVVSGNRALALAYVDARVIQDRLDEVLGVMGWQDDYEWLEDGSVLCRLKIRIGDEWITKVDVGGPSEQSDEGDRRKAAFSDGAPRNA